MLGVVAAAPAGIEGTVPAGATTTAGETTATEVVTPVAGGTLRLIHAMTAQVLGYWPEMGPADEGQLYPGVERIMEFAPGRKIEHYLAKSVVEDPDGLKMSYKLHEGILFHDGTELTAEVAKWNYELGMEGGKVQYSDAIKEFEIVDKYSYVIHLNYWTNQLLQAFGYVPMFSKDAFEKNGGKEWARTHCVGTGPFILDEFKRDQSIKWVKNPNWWAGEAYLDGIEYIAIADATTAVAMMEAGEGDIMVGPLDSQALRTLVDKGFKAQSGWASMPAYLLPNIVTESPLNGQRVREAVEYALDRPAIAEATGYGFSEPLYAIAPPGEWGSDRIVAKREYDPEKAKKLLAEAGYTDGCPIDILAEAAAGGRNTGAEAVKGYLDAVGFVTNIDIADAGRYYGSLFGTGWKDLVLMLGGTDYNYLMTCSAWWSPNPKTKLGSWKPTPELAAMFEPALVARTEEEQMQRTGDIVGLINEEALIIPLGNSRHHIVVQDWVHTDYPMEGGFVRWSWGDDWMEPH